jgi:HK97 family phage portal protein
MSFTDLFRNLGLGQKTHATGTGSVIVVEGESAVWTPKDYNNFAKEGYESNPYLYASICEIARSVAGLPWIVTERTKDGASVQVSDVANPVVNIFSRPNPEQSGATFLEAAVSYYLISGNVYIEAVGPDNGAPQELWLLRPDRMKVRVDRDGYLSGYEYKVGSKVKRLAYETILHIKNFSATSDHYGMSPLEPASRSIDSNNEARKWNYNLLKNNAKVTFALTTDGELTDQQRQRIKKEFEDRYSGSSNAAKPKVFEGGIKPHVISQSPEQMDWSEGIRLTGKEIAISLGVPPEIIGDSQNRSYASYSEARKSFYMETVLPISTIFEQELNMWLMPRIDDRYSLTVNRDEVDALQEDRSEIWTRTMNAVESGVLTKNEARALLGYAAVEGGDSLEEPMPSFGLATSSPTLQLKGDTKTVRRCSPDEQDPDRPLGEQVWCVLTDDESEVLGRHETREEADSQLALIEREKTKALEYESKVMLWKGQEQRRDEAVKVARPVFEKRLKEEIRDITDILETATAQEELVVLLDIASEQQRQPWLETMTAVYLGVGEDFARETVEQIKSSASPIELDLRHETKEEMEQWERQLTQYLDASFDKKFKDLSQTTRDFIKKQIKNYLEGGMSWFDIAQAIKRDIGDKAGHPYYQTRSERIARTETTTASSASGYFAAKATALPLKRQWFGTPDSRARKWHREGITETQDMDTPFVVKRPGKNPGKGQFDGYDQLMFPGDWNLGASPGNIINCRCAMFYVPMEEE